MSADVSNKADQLRQARQLHRAGQGDDAEALAVQLLHQQPGDAETCTFLGMLALQQNRPATAAAYLGAALQREPALPQAHLLLGLVRLKQNQDDAALQSFQRVAELEPANADAWNNQGVVLLRKKAPRPALGCFHKVLEVAPRHIDGHVNLARAHLELKQWAEAEQTLLKLLAFRPDVVTAHEFLGRACFQQGRTDQAMIALRKAVALGPNRASAWISLGLGLLESAQFDEAQECFHKAMALAPQDPVAQANAGMTDLLAGRWLEGWPRYQQRLQLPNLDMERFQVPGPLWDGQALKGRTLLVHGEQGMGDLIQFCRYVPRIVAERGGPVVLVCHPPLKPLLRTVPGVWEVVAKGDQTPPYHYRTWIMNLPGVFQTTPATIPADIPYLSADPQRVVHWGQRLTDGPRRFRVGLAWAGNPKFGGDHKRSMSLATLAPLARVPNVAFYSLQKGGRPNDAFPPELALQDFTAELTDFADTAALVMNLDLVISVDTAVAHLAGALGRPVWTLLPRIPDWRWLLDREDTPWYPTMRLFRQTTPGAWGPVLERVVQELQAKSAALPPE